MLKKINKKQPILHEISGHISLESNQFCTAFKVNPGTDLTTSFCIWRSQPAIIMTVNK